MKAPLLRSPGFPWVSRDFDMISRFAQSDVRPGKVDRAQVLTELRRNRIGGTYCSDATYPRAVVVYADSNDLAGQLAEAAKIAPPGDTLVIVEDTPDMLAMAEDIGTDGYDVVIDPTDPWSAMDDATTLFAASQHEWALVARVIGARVIGVLPSVLDAQLDEALFDTVSYRDCFTSQPATINRAIAILAEWRRIHDRTRSISAMAGIAGWKCEALERMLWLGRSASPPSAANAEEAIALAGKAGGAIAVWPSRMPVGLPAMAAAAGVPLIAVEDGFIRSVGLGAGLHPPSSIIVDSRGIYYDPRAPSDLEHFLETHPFPPDLLARAVALRATIVRYGISKYAADPDRPVPPRTTDKRIVLVPGQVEDDQSVLTGGGGVAGNFDLLKRARALEPEAHILFKPHPDVDAGFRVGKVSDAELLKYADEIIRDEAMAALLKRVDAVHVLTSLTGFEALLRGLEVTTHGHPFYAGWGLTRDMAGPIARRTRRLTLDQLVAGALLLYPIYLDPVTQIPCPAEVLVDRFRTMKAPRRTLLIRLRALQGRLAKMFGTTTD